MSIDLTPVANVLLPLASAAVTAAIGILVPAILKRLNLANDADLKANLENVLQAGAGAAYKFALSHEGGLSSVAVHNAALATAANYVMASLPDTIQKLGITPDKVQQMVSARLGAMLATDSTVTAGNVPTAVVGGAAQQPAPGPVNPAASS